MSENTTKRDVAGMITDKVIELLEQGTVPWRQGWQGGLQANLASRKPYRGINQPLLGMAGYGQPWWVSFNQAKDLAFRGWCREYGHSASDEDVRAIYDDARLGEGVQKGERSSVAVFNRKLEKAAEEGERGAYQDEKGRWRKTIWLLRFYKVWNVEQCAGLDWAVPQLVEHDPEATQKAAIEVLHDYHHREKIGLVDGPHAGYSPDLDRIQMPPLGRFKDVPAYLGTWSHECIHSTGHVHRLDRGLVTNYGSEPYAKEELVAEIGSQILVHQLGVSTDHEMQQTAAYVEGWLQALRNDRKLIVSAGSQGHYAADFILGEKYGQQAPDEPEGAVASVAATA